MKIVEQVQDQARVTTTLNCEPTHEEIAVRAYLIWEKTGKPHGREREFWLQAEAELRSERGKLNDSTAVIAVTPKRKKKASRLTTLLENVKTPKRWQG